MKVTQQVRSRLVEIGGRTSQDLGVSRIVGQVLIFLYLQEDECSLDVIGDELGLSKASVSIAVRQLEQLGLAKKVWKQGDRKNYYRSADNIASALQEGFLATLRKKVQLFGDELDAVHGFLIHSEGEDQSRELSFLKNRVKRASTLLRRLTDFLNNPVIRFFTK